MDINNLMNSAAGTTASVAAGGTSAGATNLRLSMDGIRPTLSYSPYAASPTAGGGNGLTGSPSMAAQVSGGGGSDSLPPINSLMRQSSAVAPSIGGHATAPLYPQYPTMMMGNNSSSTSSSSYQAAPLPGHLEPASQIYDLDKNFPVNVQAQYPPMVDPYHSGHYGPPPPVPVPVPQRQPLYPPSGYNAASSYNNYPPPDDYYMTPYNYMDYGSQYGPSGMGGPKDMVLNPLVAMPPMIPGGAPVVPPAASRLSKSLYEMPPTGGSVQQLGMDYEGSAGGGISNSKKGSGSAAASTTGAAGAAGGGGDKKPEKKPTSSSTARYQCSLCDGKEFISLPVISKHIRQHNLVLCNLCVKVSYLIDVVDDHFVCIDSLHNNS